MNIKFRMYLTRTQFAYINFIIQYWDQPHDLSLLALYFPLREPHPAASICEALPASQVQRPRLQLHCVLGQGNGGGLVL